jgi:hypothetical protein
MANTFHLSVYVRSIPKAVEHDRKILGIEPDNVRHDYGAVLNCDRGWTAFKQPELLREVALR